MISPWMYSVNADGTATLYLFSDANPYGSAVCRATRAYIANLCNRLNGDIPAWIETR